jgi:hypothetical protein
VGGALAPAVGLRVADAAGDAAMWTMITTVGLVAGALYWTAARVGRERAGETALPEAA